MTDRTGEEIEFFVNSVCKATEVLDREQRLVIVAECLKKWFQDEDEDTRLAAACYVIERHCLDIGKLVFGYDIDDEEA